MKYACFASFFFLLLASVAVAQNQFVYVDDNVSNYNNLEPVNTVTAFQVQDDGSLSQIAGSPFHTGGAGGSHSIDPGQITVATQNSASFLYASNNGSGTISGFSIESNTGTLNRIAGSPFVADGAPGGDYYLAATPNGKLLYASADATTVIHIYSIGSSGVLTEISGSPFSSGQHTQGLKVTPNGQFLIAGDRLNAVSVYGISSGGLLTAVAGSPFPTPASPLDVGVNCAGNLVFVLSDAINVFSQASDGSLSPVPGEPFPNGTSATSGGLAVSPNGKYLFVGDTFSSDVSSFAIGETGTLSPAPGSPYTTSNWPGGVSVANSGNYVYFALFAVGAVDGRAVGENGELTPVPNTPFTTGQPQEGVNTLTTFPAPICSGQ
jgi:6-phosphogluconolactonase